MIHSPSIRSQLPPALAWLAVVVATVSLVGCVAADVLPANCGEPSITVDARVTGDGMEPRTIDVCQNQQVHLNVASEVTGVLHFHGYDEQVPAKAIAAGDQLDWTFTAVRVGQFPIELHPLDGGEPTALGVVFVHQH